MAYRDVVGAGGLNGFTLVQEKAMLDDLKAGDFATVDLRLYTAPPVLNRTLALSDLTEATFHGYSPAASLVWLTDKVDATGRPLFQCASKQFQSTDDAVPESVTLWAITDHATPPTTLLYAEVLDTPFDFAQDGDTLTIIPVIALGPVIQS